MKSALLLVVVGCADTSEMPDASSPPFAEAEHGSVPSVVDLGGGVLAAPKVQPIFFASDSAMQSQVEAFLHELSTSMYWTTTTSEYGVGALTVLPTIVATDAAPSDEATFETWLTTHLDGTHAGWPAVDPNTIYSVFLPAGAVLHSPDGDSCEAYGAFHDELKGAHGESLVYALMPRCQGAGTDLDELTASTSHELIEAATDPRVETTPAFGDSDAEHYIWAYTPGAEVSDYCEYLYSAYQPLVGQYMVQRSWSNAAANAGHDPCVPTPSEPYVAAAPRLLDEAPLEGLTGQVMTKAVNVPLGMSKTIDIVLFSDAPTDGFSVEATDVASEFDGGAAELAFKWDRMTGKNGDTLHLTITRKRTAARTGTSSVVSDGPAGSEFVITTKRADGTDVSMWWGFATN